MPKPIDPAKWSHMFSDDVKFTQKALILHPDYINNKLFLTLKRPLTAKSHPGFWDFPGGNVLYGENAEESIINEIKEETGLENFDDLKSLLVDAQMKEDAGFYRIFVGYVCQSESENITLSMEHDEYRWVTTNEFANLEAVEILKKMVKRYQK